MNGNGYNPIKNKVLAYFVQLLLSFLVLATVLFFVYHFLPSDPIENLVTRSSPLFPSSQGNLSSREAIKDQLGLNRSIWVQFTDFFSHVFDGSFGTSFWTGSNVADLIKLRLPITFVLGIPALFCFIFFGFVWGFLQAWGCFHPFGSFLRFLNTLLFCIPAFSIASALVRFDTFLSSEFLALLVYVGTTVPLLAALVRDKILEEERKTYAQAALAKGLSRFQLLCGHLLKPCIPVGLSLLPWWWSMFMGTAVVIEPLFRISGLGLLAMEAFRNQDIPILLGLSFFIGFGRLVSGSIRDFVYWRLFYPFEPSDLK
ncbi:MAG: ABC transporter permease, partial [Pseudomonadota bacterium]